MGANPLDSTFAQENLLAGSCQAAFGAGNGSDVAYTYTAAGAEDLYLGLANAPGANHGLVVKSACDAASTELACADTGSSSEGIEFASVRLAAGQTVFVFVSASAVESAGQFQLYADRRPLGAAGAACDPTGTVSACVDGLECNATGPTTGTCANNSAAGAMACSAVVPIPPTGDPFMGTNANTVDFTPSSCGVDFGGGDVVYSYTALLNANVTFAVDSDDDLALSVRTACADVFTEVGCADAEYTGPEQVTVPNVASGTTLYLVVSGVRPGDEGAFVARVVETALVANGGTCDLAEVAAGAQACAPNTSCRVAGGNPQTRCYPTAAPILTAVQAFRSDSNGNGVADHWRLVANGSDTDLDVVGFRVRFTNAAGEDVPLRFDDGTTRSTLATPVDVGVTTPTTSTFTGLLWELTGLETVANQSELANVGLRLLDAQGRVSAELVVPFTTVVAGGVGAACTAQPSSFCAQNTRCVAATCQNPATAACTTTTLLPNNPPPAGTVVGGTFTMGNTTATADVVDPTCATSSGGKDALFRHTVATGGVDVIAQLLNGDGATLSIRGACADVTTEFACSRGNNTDPLYAGIFEVPAGTYFIHVSAASPGDEGPFAVRVWERSIVGAGSECDPLAILNRCAAGSVCKAAGSTSVCSNGTAPSLTAATARTVDRDGDGIFENVLLTVTGTDAEQDIAQLSYGTLDELGRQVSLFYRGGTDGVVNGGDTFSFNYEPLAYPFNAEPLQLGAPGNGDWLSIINQGQLRGLNLQLVDTVGGRSEVLRVPLSALPIITTRAACDPTGVSNRCGIGRTCTNVTASTNECLTAQEAAALACAAPTTLTRNVAANGTTAGAANRFQLSCSSSDASGDVLYRFTNGTAAGNVRFTLDSATDQGFAVYRTCGGPEAVCVDVVVGGSQEATTVAVAANETVFVVVAPYLSSGAGPFVLRAQ